MFFAFDISFSNQSITSFASSFISIPRTTSSFFAFIRPVVIFAVSITIAALPC